MKKYGTYLGLVAIGLFLAALILFRGNLVDYLSRSRTMQLSDSAKRSLAEQIAARYDYRQNQLPYSCTFLEFGSTGCSACRQMERVMETVRTQHAGRVQVVFVNVSRKENQELAEYFGIATIPTQVLLDRSGAEYYRHNGYISAEELAKHFR